MDSQKFTLQFASIDEVNLLLTALLELPAKNSYEMINKIRQQTQTQLEAASVVERPEKAKTDEKK